MARDKNHPNVAIWSVANEPQPTGLMARFADRSITGPADQKGKDFLETFLRRARQLDPTRLVTLVGVIGGPASWLEACDVV